MISMNLFSIKKFHLNLCFHHHLIMLSHNRLCVRRQYAKHHVASYNINSGKLNRISMCIHRSFFYCSISLLVDYFPLWKLWYWKMIIFLFNEYRVLNIFHSISNKIQCGFNEINIYYVSPYTIRESHRIKMK